MSGQPGAIVATTRRSDGRSVFPASFDGVDDLTPPPPRSFPPFSPSRGGVPGARSSAYATENGSSSARFAAGGDGALFFDVDADAATKTRSSVDDEDDDRPLGAVDGADAPAFAVDAPTWRGDPDDDGGNVAEASNAASNADETGESTAEASEPAVPPPPSEPE